MSIATATPFSTHNAQKGRTPWNKNKKTGLIPKTAFKKGQHVSSISEFKKGFTPWNKGKKTSEEIRKKISLSKKGKVTKSEHWNWKGGITPLNVKIRSSFRYKKWRFLVFQRDKYTCQQCGQWGGELNADHIKDFAYYLGLRFEISNGQTLCVDCHKIKGTYKGKDYAINATQ